MAGPTRLLPQSSSSSCPRPGKVRLPLTSERVKGYFHHNDAGFLPLFPLPLGEGRVRGHGS